MANNDSNTQISSSIQGSSLNTQNIATSSSSCSGNINLQKYDNNSAILKLPGEFLDLYEPHLKKVQNAFEELTYKQKKVEMDLINENRNFSNETLKPTQNMIKDLKLYKEKLINIRKQMIHIHQKTQNLKKRANYIKDIKTKEMEEKIQKRQQEVGLIGGGGTGSAGDSGSF